MHNHAAPGVNGVSSHAPGVNLGIRFRATAPITTIRCRRAPQAFPSSAWQQSQERSSHRTLSPQAADITFNAPAGLIAAHLNSFSGIEIGVAVESAGGIDASQNWWGCPGGPGGIGCSTATGSPVYAPSWLPATPAAPAVP